MRISENSFLVPTQVAHENVKSQTITVYIGSTTTVTSRRQSVYIGMWVRTRTVTAIPPDVDWVKSGHARLTCDYAGSILLVRYKRKCIFINIYL